MHKVTVTTSDGFKLHATAFGDSRRARAGVLIASAMGVEQTYYADFPHWLAAQGYWVVTFDYRGIGQSRPATLRRSLRGFEADVKTFEEQVSRQGGHGASVPRLLPGGPSNRGPNG